MNIENMSVAKLMKLAEVLADVKLEPPGLDDSGELLPPSDSHWQIGKDYLIRTVTHIQIGTLIAVTDKELVLCDASWIADTGRFEQCVKDGELSEVEPFPDGELVIVGRGALVDAVRWTHELPRQQK